MYGKDANEISRWQADPRRDDSEPRRYRTVAEVAALLRVSKMTVYRLVHSGELDAVRVDNSFRIPETVVRAYLDDVCGSAPESH